MTTALTYAIKYVGNMDAAVSFHQQQLGLRLRFQSPDWSEFDTGSTTLALHSANREHPAGSVELGFTVTDIAAFHAERSRQGVQFTSPPTELHGQRIAKFRDTDGAECSVSGS